MTREHTASHEIALTDAQVADLLRALDHRTAAHTYLRDYCLVLLMVDTGLRVGELVQLFWSDVLMDGRPLNFLRVRAAIAKTHAERTLPLSRRLRDALLQYGRESWPGNTSLDHWLFPSPRHPEAHLSVRMVQTIVQAAGAMAGIPKLHPHALRHTFATQLMRVCSTRIVQTLLGHANLSSTQVYTHPDAEDLQKAIDSLPGRCLRY